MPRGAHTVRRKSALPIGLSDALITTAFGVGIVVVWVLLVVRLVNRSRGWYEQAPRNAARHPA